MVITMALGGKRKRRRRRRSFADNLSETSTVASPDMNELEYMEEDDDSGISQLMDLVWSGTWML